MPGGAGLCPARPAGGRGRAPPLWGAGPGPARKDAPPETFMAVTPVAAKGRSPVVVEWIYIRYRTVLLLGGLLLLAAAGGMVWWGTGAADREGAVVSAVGAAGQRVSEAGVAAPDSPRLPDARARLDEAQAALQRRDWRAAERGAAAATALADAILEEHKSGAGGTSVAVSRASGDVRIKRAGQFLWEPVEAGDDLHSGDQLRTGASGSAQLLYFDGTTMTVSPGTLLEIRELHRDPERRTQRVSERLAFGQLSAETRESAGYDSVHEVATEAASVRAKQAAEFQIRHDRDGRSEVVATRGELALAAGAREVPLPEATRVTVAAGEIVEKTRLLDPPLLSAPADQTSIVGGAGGGVTLAWAPVDRAGGYRVQVSDRPLFPPGGEARAVQGTSHPLGDLAPGSYFWRVVALDEQGREGRWSESRKFRLLGEEFRDPSDRTPPDLQVSEIMVVGTNAIVSGRSEPGALVWVDGERVDVEDDGRFTWIVKLRQDGENRIRFVAQDAAGNESRRVGTAWLDVF